MRNVVHVTVQIVILIVSLYNDILNVIVRKDRKVAQVALAIILYIDFENEDVFNNSKSWLVILNISIL